MILLALIHIVLVACGVAMVGYLLVLTAAAVAAVVRKSAVTQGDTRFAVVIPAHNEELNIESVVKGMLEVDYPRDLFEVVVVADNCADDTARLARDAGAAVIERRDPDRRGKGYALDYAFEILLERDPSFDAFVVLDADSLVARGFLAAMDAAMAAGAQAVQGHYDVLNPAENWRTALMYAALSAVHLLRPLGRSFLGLSVGLKGNGMCFARDVVARFGWNAYSVVEDMEYGFKLCLEGIPVRFAARAKVWAQMPTGSKEATTQRMRWEGGRNEMCRQWFVRLLSCGIRRRSAACLDMAVDLAIPPLTLLVAIASLLGVASAALHLDGYVPLWIPLLWLSSLGIIGVYVLTGLLLNRSPAGVYKALLFAPIFVVWKIWVYLQLRVGQGLDQWVRTGRSKING